MGKITLLKIKTIIFPESQYINSYSAHTLKLVTVMQFVDQWKTLLGVGLAYVREMI